ncbi:MAG: hypothetical protein Q8Q85_00050 [Gemmatimonadales bacterium]|nr:hypothetical protein [Gemmatimonadales bacterium]
MHDPRYPGYGVPSQAYPGSGGPGAFPYGADPGSPRPAVVQMPRAHEMGGQGQIPWVRYPFYPTAPFYSTDPNVGYQTRFYSGGIIGTDADYVVNTEAIRTVQFDIPCRLIGFTGAVMDTAGAGFPVGHDRRDFVLFRLEYTNGDRLHTAARLGSEVLGSMERPGEIGGTGWTIDQGASVVLGITPLRTNLRCDITLICLEMRGARNFSGR